MDDAPEIISLNAEHLDIEELERRLELTLVMTMSSGWCAIHGEACNCNGTNLCQCNVDVCNCDGTLCGCNGTLCVVDGCGADLCITDGCSSNTCIDPTQPGCNPS